MYLHNTSKTRGITVNTTIGLIGIKPNNIVCIDGKLLLPYSNSIRIATEQEYKDFIMEGKTPKEEQVKITPNKPEKSSEQTENILGDIKDTIKDEGAFDLIANLFNKMSGSNEQPEIETIIEEKEPVATPIGAQTENLIDSIINNIPVHSSVDTEQVSNPNAGQVIEPVIAEVVVPDALEVKETSNEAEINKIQDEIDALKETWEQTSAVRKKEKIQKQIVQLEKQKQKLIENSIDE